MNTPTYEEVVWWFAIAFMVVMALMMVAPKTIEPLRWVVIPIIFVFAALVTILGGVRG